MRSRPELIRALGAVVEAPCRPELAGALALGPPPGAADHAEVFLLQTHPYASVHLGGEGMLGGDAADRVAGFWRTLGLAPPNPPDHLAVLLAGYARLVKEAASMGTRRRRDAVRRAGVVLLWDHLASWAPAYLEAVRSLHQPFYRAWAELALEALVDETASTAGEPLPSSLRQAPDHVSTEGGRERLVAEVLSPVRSGMVVTRRDLGRACGELGLGLRHGERSYVLGALLDQNPQSAIAWLAGHARTWAVRHAGLRSTSLGSVAAWWEARALHTSGALAELSSRSSVPLGPTAVIG